MAEAQIGQEKWKSARDFATTTTQVSVVLFAALIASWVGMWDHLNQYRGAAASREGIERQHRIAQEREQAVLKEAIRGRLLSDVQCNQYGESTPLSRTPVRYCAV